MSTDAINNKLRLDAALTVKSPSTQQPKNQAQLAQTTDKIGERSSDAVRSTVDTRLTQIEPPTGSGRSVSEIRDLVQTGKYLDETPVDAVAGAVARDLL